MFHQCLSVYLLTGLLKIYRANLRNSTEWLNIIQGPIH